MRLRYLLYLILLLPVFIFRDYTPANELKYLSIVEEAIRNDTWFTFYNQGEIYSDKPPLYFWLLMMPRILTGKFHMWIMALFSLLPAMGVMAVMDKWFRMAGIKHNPWASNLLLLTTLMFLGSALILRMDILMTFFIVLSLYTFFRMYSGTARPAHKWLLPVWIFLAVFSKGPIGFLVPVLSITVFLIVKKDIRSFGRYLGWRQWFIMLGLAGLWFLLIYREGGGAYLESLLVKQTVGRGIDAFHHKEPFWYYMKNIVWMLAPWTLLYAAMAWKGIRGRILVGDTRTLFFTVIVTTFTMLSLFSSKIQVYLLPVFPFVVYICSAWLSEFENTKAAKITAAIPAVIFAAAYPASFIIDDFIKYEYQSLLVVRIGILLLSAGALAAVYLIWKNKTIKGVVVLSLSMLVMMFSSFFGIAQFNPSLGSRHYAEEALELAREKGINRFTYYKYYTAPNMDVYIGRTIHKIDDVATLDSLDKVGIPTIMFVRDKELRVEPEFAEWMKDVPEAGRHSKYSWYIIGTDRDKTDGGSSECAETEPVPKQE